MRVLLMFLGLLFLNTDAFAWTDPGSNDVSLKIIGQIFGSLVPGGGIDAFGNAIATLNGAILIVGGALVSYTILLGTIGTAHDGEMMGKKFSSIWIPVRTALGFALVLPAMSGGYCVLQSLVMWFVLQGIGLANDVWKSYVASVPSIDKISANMTPATKKSIYEFTKQVALAQSCVEANKKHLTSEYTGIIKSKIGDYNYGVSTTDNLTYYFGDQGGHFSLITRQSCGKITFPEPQKQGTGTSGTGGGKLGNLNTNIVALNPSPIYDAHKAQVQQVISQTQALAQAAVASDTSIDPVAVKAIADSYITNVEAASVSFVSSKDPFAAAKMNVAEQGWFMAGSWFTQLVMINKTVQQTVNLEPQASATVSQGEDMFSWIDSTQDTMLKAQEKLRLDSQRMAGVIAKGKEITATVTEDSGGAYSTIAAGLAKSVTDLDIYQLKNSTKHPIIILQEIGQGMLSTWASWMAWLSIAGFASGFITGGAVINVIVSFLMIPVAALLGMGFTLAYMLPNLPFLMWLGVVLGWLIMVVEAIIAAPLWAIMHLHPQGDDQTGKGGNGYMLLFGLIIRPTLIIFGLIAALTVSEIMGEFVNKVFFEVFNMGSASGVIAIIATVFSIGIYTMAQFTMMKKSFELMHIIPDQLLRWVGGGQEQLGQNAGSMAEGSGKAIAAATVAGGFMGKDGVKGLGDAGSQWKAENQAKERDKQTNAQLAESKIGNANAQQGTSNAIDAEYGIGSGEYLGSAPSGTTAVNANKERTDFAMGISALGGKDSADAQAFTQKLKDHPSANGSLAERAAFREEALTESLNTRFGEGASDLALQNGKVNPVMTAKLNETYSTLRANGATSEEATLKIASAINPTNLEFQQISSPKGIEPTTLQTQATLNLNNLVASNNNENRPIEPTKTVGDNAD